MLNITEGLWTTNIFGTEENVGKKKYNKEITYDLGTQSMLLNLYMKISAMTRGFFFNICICCQNFPSPLSPVNFSLGTSCLYVNLWDHASGELAKRIFHLWKVDQNAPPPPLEVENFFLSFIGSNNIECTTKYLVSFILILKLLLPTLFTRQSVF